VLGVALLGWFGFYLWRLAHGPVEEPDLIGTAAALGSLPRRTRRTLVPVLLAIAAAVVLLCAEPFATSLIHAGTELGVDRFLLVQWLAPLASEAPEFVVAILLASRGKGAAAIALLISSKVNQWTLLLGSLPLASLAGGGGTSLVLDGRQVEEMLLTATQTLMGVAMLLALQFHRRAAAALLVLFVVQFPLTATEPRLVLSGVYLLIAAGLLIHHRGHIWPTLRAPWQAVPVADDDTGPRRRDPSPAAVADRDPAP